MQNVLMRSPCLRCDHDKDRRACFEGCRELLEYQSLLDSLFPSAERREQAERINELLHAIFDPMTEKEQRRAEYRRQMKRDRWLQEVVESGILDGQSKYAKP